MMLTAHTSAVSSPGQISASLAAMHRTVDDYDSMAKREIIKAKQEKAQMCVPALFSPAQHTCSSVTPSPRTTQARAQVPRGLR